MSESTDPPSSPQPASEPADPPVLDSDADTAEAPAPVRVKEPSQQDLDELPADRRLELLALEREHRALERERRRQGRHQWFNSAGILLGALFTVGSLVATTVTLRIGQEELRTAKEGQVTDRYAKAVEQLGSSRREVRTAAIYALERIATDSPRDRFTIRDVLAAYVREHDPDSTVTNDKLPEEPDTDVHAALSVLGRRSPDPEGAPHLDLHAIRARSAQLTKVSLGSVNLTEANLTDANLRDANLRDADLIRAGLTKAHLNRANLIEADLTEGDLTQANLAGANLTRAYMGGANLTRAYMGDANLESVNLSLANLRGAQLSGANLTRAYLSGADLRGADLSDTNLNRVSLSGADLGGADLSDTDLRTTDLKYAELSSAVWSDRTVWPASVGGSWGMRARSDPFEKGHYRVRKT